MITALKIIHSDTLDPYRNLALEEELLNSVEDGTCILYLWQNKNTVVIGRNQNPWVECRTELLSEEGGHLARRLSGGGAVYHDIGNLNFTFLMNQSDYDVEKQLRVIQNAVEKFGIPVTFSGRNDLLADGRKFSGNAFYHASGKSYHHGTILINADTNMVSRYLSPSAAKLKAKGVSSVRSRIINLTEIVPNITLADIKDKLVVSFSEVYELPVTKLILTDSQLDSIEIKAKKFGSWNWLYGAPLPFSFSCKERFPWGSFQLLLQVNKGCVTEAKVYTDAMQWQLASAIEEALKSVNFTISELTKAIKNIALDAPDIIDDICYLLTKQNI